MTKILKMAATSLLVSGMTFPLPLLAGKIIGAPPLPATSDSQVDDTATDSANMFSIRLQHRFNDSQPLPPETIAIVSEAFAKNPLVFFETLKKNFSKHLEQQNKPVQVNTELELLLPKGKQECLDKLPTLSIETQIDKAGAGQSKVVFPAFRHQVPKKCGQGLIDWKGLDGQFNFTDQFENLTANLNIAGLTIEEDGVFGISLGKTALSGVFDSRFMPIQMGLNLPSLKAGGNTDRQFDLQQVVFKLNTEKTPKGVDLNNVNFNVGHLDFAGFGSKFRLEGLAVTTSGEEQNGSINYTVQTQLGQLAMPAMPRFKEGLEVSHEGKLVFERIDEEALFALQTLARQLAGQQYNPMLQMMVLSQLMQVAPKLLAKSPGVALNSLVLKTSKGDLQGQFNVSLDGQKVTSLTTPAALIRALQAQANFTIGNELLELITATFKISLIKALLVDAGDGKSKKLIAVLKGRDLRINGMTIPLFGAPRH